MFKTLCALCSFTLAVIGCAQESDPQVAESAMTGGSSRVTPEHAPCPGGAANEATDKVGVDVGTLETLATEAAPQAVLGCEFKGTVCDRDHISCQNYMNEKCGGGYYGKCEIVSADCGGTSLTRYNTWCCRD